MKVHCAAFNSEMTDHPTGQAATASFVEKSGGQADIIRHHGRMADLIAVDQRDVDRNLGTMDSQDYLAANGVSADIWDNSGPGAVAKRLHSASADLGALMVMGAYGDSYERETMFGGNTQVWMDSPVMSILFIH